MTALGSGWKIDEPTTTLTDILLGMVTLGLAIAIAVGGLERLDQWYWVIAFIVTALTAWFGAYFHGFSRQVNEAVAAESWYATLVLTGVTDFFLLAAPATSFLEGWARSTVIFLALIKAFVYLRLIRRDPTDFRAAAMDSGISLLGLGAIAATGLGGAQSEAALWIIGGVGLGLVGGVIQAAKFGVHDHFNHNDIFHLIHMVVAWLIYTGVQAL